MISSNLLDLFAFPFFLEQISTADVVLAKASNPSKSSVLSSRYSSDLRQIQVYFCYNGDQRPRSWGMFPSSHSPNTSRYPIFLLFLHLSHPISRNWGTKSWFHQSLLPMSIFLGLWVTLIHLISFIKKPTKSPSNSLQWIYLPRTLRLPLEIGPKCLRDGETGFVGCPRKRVEIGNFMIWINAWLFRCLGWRGTTHFWLLHLISSPMPWMLSSLVMA